MPGNARQSAGARYLACYRQDRLTDKLSAMTTKSLYLILCVAASLTLLAFTQKTISGNNEVVASSTSVNGQQAPLRPTTSTGNIDKGTSTGVTTSATTNGTNSTTSTTSTNSSTSMDYPTTTSGGTTNPVTSPGPNVTTSSGNTTTMDIPVHGSTTNPNQ